MDGRVQRPIADFGRKKFGAEFADTITEAGLVGLLARLQLPASPHAEQSEAAREQSDGGQANNPSQTLLNSIKNKLAISIELHHSKGILVHGHQDCAGNPVSLEKHTEDVKKSVEIIKGLIENKVPVIGLFVKRSSTNPKTWEASEV